MQNANWIELVCFAASVLTLVYAVLWWLVMRSVNGDAEGQSRAVIRAAGLNLFKAKTRIYRVAALYCLIWGRSLFMPDDNTGGFWGALIGVLFIGALAMEYVEIKRDGREQKELELDVAAMQAAGYTKRAKDPPGVNVK